MSKNRWLSQNPKFDTLTLFGRRVPGLRLEAIKAMTDEIDIYRTANLMLKLHGDMEGRRGH